MTAEDRVGRDKARIDEWIRYAATSGETPAIDAATVVVLRDGDDGVETLMLRRNSKIAFGGMWVFPGGRVDEADRAAAADALDAARIAAVREAEEEAALVIPAGELVMFAHWIPPPIAPKRYATWFFAARVADRAHRIDDGEIVESDWMTPEECLGRHHQGEIELAPPTWVTLHSLRGHGRVDGALTTLADRPARHHATRIGRTDEGPVAMWEGDAGYDAADPTITGPRHRLEMYAEGYHYDDSGVRG
ncbi:MAG: NUDIX domain-containing protein [Acidimicrobiales bacterium]